MRSEGRWEGKVRVRRAKRERQEKRRNMEGKRDGVVKREKKKFRTVVEM